MSFKYYIIPQPWCEILGNDKAKFLAHFFQLHQYFEKTNSLTKDDYFFIVAGRIADEFRIDQRTYFRWKHELERRKIIQSIRLQSIPFLIAVS